MESSRWRPRERGGHRDRPHWPQHQEPAARSVRNQHDAVVPSIAKFNHRRRSIVGEVSSSASSSTTLERQVLAQGSPNGSITALVNRPVLREALTPQSWPGGKGYSLGCHFSHMLDREVAS